MGHFATDEIKVMLIELIDCWNQLKQKCSKRKTDLIDSLQCHQYFTEVNEAESWIAEKEILAKNIDYGKDEDASEGLIKRHDVFMKDLDTFHNAIEEIKEQASQPQLTGNSSIESRQVQIEKRYDNLVSLGNDRGKRLQDTRRAYQLVREAAELSNWIMNKEQHIQLSDFKEDIEQVEIAQKKLDEMQTDIRNNEAQIANMNEKVRELSTLGQTEAAQKIKILIQDVNNKWTDLHSNATQHFVALQKAYKLREFYRETDEIIDWITEKEEILNEEEIGKDLRHVQALQRKHEGIERDLISLSDKVETVENTSKNLVDTNPESSNEIIVRRKEIANKWMKFQSKISKRKEKLQDSYDFQKLSADYRDMISWISSVKELIVSEELEYNVTGSKALLQRHIEYRSEIDSKEPSFQAFQFLSQLLLQNNHYASKEIQEKMKSMNLQRKDLETAWVNRKHQL